MLTRKELEQAMEEGTALLKGDLSRLKPGLKGRGWKLPPDGGQDVVAYKSGRGRIRGVVFDAGSAEKRRKAIDKLMEMMRRESRARKKGADQIIAVMRAAMAGRSMEDAFIEAMAPEVALARFILSRRGLVDLADVRAGLERAAGEEVQNGASGPHAGNAKRMQSIAGMRFMKNSPSAAAAAPEPAQIAEADRPAADGASDPEKDMRHNAAVFSICFPEGVAKASGAQAPAADAGIENAALAAAGRNAERMQAPARG